MQYSNNVLPTKSSEWTLHSATLLNNKLSLLAGGSATVTLPKAAGSNELPSMLMLLTQTDKAVDVYNPTAYIEVDVAYGDDSLVSISTPISSRYNGKPIEIVLKTNAGDNIIPFSYIRYTIRCSEAVEINLFSLCISTTNIVVENKNYFGMQFSSSDGLKINRSDGGGEIVMNGDTFAMRSRVGTVMVDKLFFDAVTGEYMFMGSVNVVGGNINIGDNFIVDTHGNVTMSASATLTGAAAIYAGKFYAGKPGDSSGYSEMTSNGFNVYGRSGLKVRLGFTNNTEDYPFMALGQGDGTPNSVGFMKKFGDGLWIGNSAPEPHNGTFQARAGYNGIFFSFAENVAYVVNGTNMKNIYTGDAIAKFG